MTPLPNRSFQFPPECAKPELWLPLYTNLGWPVAEERRGDRAGQKARGGARPAEPTFTDVPGTPGVLGRGVLGLRVAQVEQGLHRDPGGQVAHSSVGLLDLGDGVDPCQNLREHEPQHRPGPPASRAPSALVPAAAWAEGRGR